MSIFTYHDKNKITESLEEQGLKNIGMIYWNLSTPSLYEEVIKRGEGAIAHLGPLVVRTGHYTGRSPDAKFTVKEPSSEDKIWWGKINRPFGQKKFDALYYKLLAYLQGKDMFIQDCYAGADPDYRIKLRVITESAWHNLFARNMFIQYKLAENLKEHKPDFTIINVPKFNAIPEIDGTTSESFVIINIYKKLVLIGGTSYAGEIKKSIFTILNYLLPQEKVLSMHCSANVGKEGDVAVFFGLSGTGKTTLSADPERVLIGDDEHGWSDKGIFNFEGGCYAKVIRLSKESEPEIYECTRKFGTILENVHIDYNSKRVDLDNSALTENTRAAYPITHISNSLATGLGDHPKNIIMLTCDAFGVMPPVAKLTTDQAIYHFLSGYTSKVGGTERGMGSEPEATFSACFGAPFMSLPPTVYAELLEKKIINHNVNCWLVNTGWIGGGYKTGSRILISYTRAIINGILEGLFENIETIQEPYFGLHIPKSCFGVPLDILNPIHSWDSKSEYEQVAYELVAKFNKNFEQFSGLRDYERIQSHQKVK